MGASPSVVVDRDILVLMRDGISLATDVYRPVAASAAGALPVLLNRTPYNKAKADAPNSWARMFARNGYIAVVQDCRGCYASTGRLNFLFADADDGCDTVRWLLEQPWCDGSIGTWGMSWEGWAQTALAAAGAPGLRAITPFMSGANGYTNSIRHGGAMELRWLGWAFAHAAQNTNAGLKPHDWMEATLNAGPVLSDWLRRWPLRPGMTQLALVPDYEHWLFELLRHDTNDAYWQHPSVNPAAHAENFADTPALLIGGWYDSYARGTIELYQTLRAADRGPVRLLMGPWTHGGTDRPYAGDVWFGEEAALDLAPLHLRWFNHCLKGADDGLRDEAPIRLFVMGGGLGSRGPGGRLLHGGRWREEFEWPLARTRFTPYYLHDNGGLSPDSPTQDTATTFRFDPTDPVPTIGGSISALNDLVPLPSPERAVADDRLREIVPPGGFDQRETPSTFGCMPPHLPLAARPDVLVFQTPPLDTAVEVTGPIEVRLWVTSTAVDTDFTAKLIDVYPPSASWPDGYCLNLTDSITRLRHRTSPPRLLTPGEIVELTITLYPTSNLFARGHRIRLDISSSNFPRFDVNSNTGEPAGRQRRIKVADNTVFHAANRPSHVLLPLIPPFDSRR